MRVQFTSRKVLYATSLVALTLVGFVWLRRLTGINPSSETVWIVGEKVDANWQDGEWRHTTGIILRATQFKSADWNGQAMLKVHQPLLTIAYNNYFGQEVYRATVYIDGRRTDDWQHYVIQPMGTGGGIVDGGTTVSCNHSTEASSIELVVNQYLNSYQRAKRLELVYDRVGNTFVRRNAAQPRIAVGAVK